LLKGAYNGKKGTEGLFFIPSVPLLSLLAQLPKDIEGVIVALEISGVIKAR